MDGIGRRDFVLCVCQYGHSRSAGLARCLHGMNVQAVAVGFQTSPAAIDVLAKRAAAIVACCREADAFLATVLPASILTIRTLWDIGPDIWVNPYSPDMGERWKTFVRSHGVCPACWNPASAIGGHGPLCLKGKG